MVSIAPSINNHMNFKKGSEKSSISIPQNCLPADRVLRLRVWSRQMTAMYFVQGAHVRDSQGPVLNFRYIQKEEDNHIKQDFW